MVNRFEGFTEEGLTIWSSPRGHDSGGAGGMTVTARYRVKGGRLWV
jgi:hypothetical protein